MEMMLISIFMTLIIRKIDKGNLSMGERQMCFSLLGALVEETEIEFPVFIDSPMQKFDASHTRNVLTKFYPKVSKQVVLFPLLMKEMTESEYKMISPLVGKAYLIENSDNGSSFTEVKTETLFNKYKELKLCSINISTSKQNQAVVTKLTAKLTGSTKENVIARMRWDIPWLQVEDLLSRNLGFMILKVRSIKIHSFLSFLERFLYSFGVPGLWNPEE